MDITEAIKTAESRLADLIEEIAALRENIAGLEGDKVEVKKQLEGLRSFAMENGLLDDAVESPPAGLSVVDGADVVAINADIALPSEPKPRTNLVLLSRSEAVLTVLTQATSAMDRTAIQRELVYGGRDDDLDDVSLTLSGLKRTGRIERLGKGMWSPVETPATGS